MERTRAEGVKTSAAHGCASVQLQFLMANGSDNTGHRIFMVQTSLPARLKLTADYDYFLADLPQLPLVETNTF